MSSDGRRLFGEILYSAPHNFGTKLLGPQRANFSVNQQTKEGAGVDDDDASIARAKHATAPVCRCSWTLSVDGDRAGENHFPGRAVQKLAVAVSVVALARARVFGSAVSP